jgi:hypothetical protein
MGNGNNVNCFQIKQVRPRLEGLALSPEFV